jgi:FAD/FMN-containing dehydrogenase
LVYDFGSFQRVGKESRVTNDVAMTAGAFGALGTLAPNYYVQDGVVPRSRLPEIMKRIAAISKDFNLRIANVFHAGDGNLHPNLLFDMRTPVNSTASSKPARPS